MSTPVAPDAVAPSTDTAAATPTPPVAATEALSTQAALHKANFPKFCASVADLLRSDTSDPSECAEALRLLTRCVARPNVVRAF